jgi:hypothetical protein
MSSPLNRQHRRTAPYVIMNNHTRTPSVAYSARQPEQISNSENSIQNLTNTPNQNDIDVTTTSIYDIVRRAQVCQKFSRKNDKTKS